MKRKFFARSSARRARSGPRTPGGARFRAMPDKSNGNENIKKSSLKQSAVIIFASRQKPRKKILIFLDLRQFFLEFLLDLPRRTE
ncbi:MAG: hypothetical protein LBS70_01815 [Candidatus Accumulibacter sp.]|nr:hypothetical protein [Accumulibacter sp.]